MTDITGYIRKVLKHVRVEKRMDEMFRFVVVISPLTVVSLRVVEDNFFLSLWLRIYTEGLTDCLQLRISVAATI